MYECAQNARVMDVCKRTNFKRCDTYLHHVRNPLNWLYRKSKLKHIGFSFYLIAVERDRVDCYVPHVMVHEIDGSSLDS